MSILFSLLPDMKCLIGNIAATIPAELHLLIVLTLGWCIQDKYNGLSFTMERPRTCPIPFLCWPFNCTILCPLKLFVRSTDGEICCLQVPPLFLVNFIS